MRVFSRVAIIGLGLIGGSVAAAIQKRKLATHIVAYDQQGESLELALQRGIINSAAPSIADAVSGADLVLIAVPVLTIESILREIPPGLLITDVGSVKQQVIDACETVYGAVPKTLVPGHPIAGSEKHGVAAANADLFEHHKVILTPNADTDATSLTHVRDLWQRLGAVVVEMTVAHHDEVLAQTSHLPHLLAYALVDTLSAQGDSMEIFQYAAGGFRDFSRIAASDPAMWRDIFQANGPALIAILDRFLSELGDIRELIVAGDPVALEAVLQRAKEARDHFSELKDHRG
ncbi:MAG: prephenate dehydrogenase/arogenate dehydrogenase family protein [Pseudomonadales bacterium]|nr:prephenate dehydrogenase/arogenate dehydrogenase family protein [Pseudomonadales bacterium]